MASGRASFCRACSTVFAGLSGVPTSCWSKGRGRRPRSICARGDIANMGFAEAADVPVILVGDIDRGGVIAALVGTHAVLERRRAGAHQRRSSSIASAAILRFSMRGCREIVAAHRLGVRSASCRISPTPRRLPAEDVLGLAGDGREAGAHVRIAVPRLPRIANFDDLDPLRAEPDVEVLDRRAGASDSRRLRSVLIPGSKSTIADLEALRQRGLGHRHRGAPPPRRRVLGLCGGFQMLGRTIADPDGIEGRPGTVAGLGAARRRDGSRRPTRRPARSLAATWKAARRSPATRSISAAARGRIARVPSSTIGGRPDGAVSADGLVAGTYVHGLFASDGFRRAFLPTLGARSTAAYEAGVEAALDGLAAHLAAPSRPGDDPRYRAIESAIVAASADEHEEQRPGARRSGGCAARCRAAPPWRGAAGIEPGAVDLLGRRSGAARRAPGRARRRPRLPASRRSAICALARRAARSPMALRASQPDQRGGRGDQQPPRAAPERSSAGRRAAPPPSRRRS